MTFKEELIQQYQLSENKIEFIEELKELIDEISPLNHQPVNRVRWVDISQVQANDYNPNSVAKTEMKLLYTSILHDGYTQPIVTVYDKKKKKYVIVDGFHRYLTCKTHDDVKENNHGKLPIVVIDKDVKLLVHNR